MEKTIEQIAREYLKAKAEAMTAKAKQDEIAMELKDRLLVNNGKAVEVDGNSVALQIKQSISFDDALLPYLKANGLQTYVQETIDDSGLKKAIKKSEILAKQIARFTIIKEVKALITKKIKR